MLNNEADKRSWEEIATEMAYETDPQKLVSLCRELDASLLEVEREKVRKKLRRGEGRKAA